MIGNPKTTRLVAVLVIAALVITMAAALLGCSVSTQSSARGTETDVDPVSGLRWVALADLPPEARDTLDLIDSGGPFPYRRDGAVFGNREGLLPNEPHGYYREYTVRTPSESDRGPRRIVAGDNGERYYTADHYASFRRVRMDS